MYYGPLICTSRGRLHFNPIVPILSFDCIQVALSHFYVMHLQSLTLYKSGQFYHNLICMFYVIMYYGPLLCTSRGPFLLLIQINISMSHLYVMDLPPLTLYKSGGIFFFNWFPCFFRFQVLRALTLYKSGLFVSSLHCLHVFCHLTLFKSAWPLYVIFSGALTLYKSGPIFINNITYHFTFHKLFSPYCFSMYFI